MTRTRRLVTIAAVLNVLVAGACSSDEEDTAPTATTTTSMATTATTAGGGDTTASGPLPLGDGKLSDGPQKGSLWLCQDPNPNAPGASGPTPWIDGSTWNPDEQPSVQGDVEWPDARFEATVRGDKRVLSGNRLPVGNRTGTFPIASSDPAHTYDRNPNSISAGDVDVAVPAQPERAAQASCVGFGAIGVLVDGSLLFNAVDAQGRDAPAHEVTDRCDGHPAPGGIYHHHNVPSCLVEDAQPGEPLLVGYALDGFGIFVERDADGSLPANDALDECHGRTSSVPWDGKDVTRYHYVATAEYPYSVACFRGTPADI